MIKVSIIVPVYNAEKTIMNAMRGLLSQTLKDIEIILVDDCSTDASPAYLDAFSQEIPDKITVLRTGHNSGAGGARNLGLDKASGEYIGFVDSDDIIAPEMYEELYKIAAANDSDIVDSGYYNEGRDFAKLHTDDSMAGILDGRKRSALIASGGYIVTKIFRRSMIEKYHMRFRELATLEDSEFLNMAFAVANRIDAVKKIFYKYCYYNDSFSRINNLERYFANIYGAMSANYMVLHQLPVYEEIRSAVEYEIIQMYSFGVNMCVKEYIDNGNELSKPLLDKLGKLKGEIVKGGYDNEYIIKRIDKADIELMILNDKSSEELLRKVRA